MLPALLLSDPSRRHPLQLPLAILAFIAAARLALADDSSSSTSTADASAAVDSTQQSGSTTDSPPTSISGPATSLATGATSTQQNATGTATETAEWATKTSGGMTQGEQDGSFIVLQSDSAIDYWCPHSADKWEDTALSDSLQAKTATGAGCTASYTFTGDSVQIYGATGVDAGVFGCSVTVTSSRNETDWWDAAASANYFRPYAGSCSIAGIGYGKHTVQLVNSPSLRYTANTTQPVWENLAWSGCCSEHTWADGEATTVAPDSATVSASATASATASASSSATATDDFLGMPKKYAIPGIVALAALVVISSLLIGCLCCRKRPASNAPGAGATRLATALRKPSDSDEEAESSSSSTEEAAASVPVMCAGARQCGAVANSISIDGAVSSLLEATATANATGNGTATETAVWATKTSGGMAASHDEQDTIVLHDDSGVVYSCPKTDDKWSVESLTDSLTAHTALGPGCAMTYTFTGTSLPPQLRGSAAAGGGDSIQLYGATGTNAGPLGCQVDLSSDLNATSWYQGQDTANQYRPYKGLCIMQGLGYGKHTVQLFNSPDNPGTVYFTGLHYTTNSSQTAWETRAWEGCCNDFTFPDGATTTITPDATATSTSGAGSGSSGGIGGFDGTTTTFIIVAVGAVIILGALLVGCLCCRKRPAAKNSSGAGASKLAAALKNTDSGGSSEDDAPLVRWRKRDGDDDTTTADDGSTIELTDLPTLSSSSSSAACTGLSDCADVASSISAAEAMSSLVISSMHASEMKATQAVTATAAWQTKTSGGMIASHDEENSIVLHDDSGIVYSCPKAADKWTVESLSNSLTAHTALGPGCEMTYTFTDGATGTDAGPFGCQVDLSSSLNATSWYQGQDTANQYRPYKGLCIIQGLGYGKHTVMLINSPDNPGAVYFTGLRYTTNASQTPWETRAWSGCCAAYTFPDGATTTVPVEAGATSTTGAGSGTSGGVLGMSSGMGAFVICGIAGVIMIAALLVGCLCCRKRPAAGASSSSSSTGGGGGAKSLAQALKSDGSSEEDESRPLRSRHRKSTSFDEEASTASEDDSTDSDEREKRKRRSRRRRGRR
ncbi:hypothetical protein JCM8097_004931 [Rhodosporidiobolus ruineniae]